MHQVKYEAKIAPFTFQTMYTLAITHPTTICCILPIANIACTGAPKAHTGFKIAGANFHTNTMIRKAFVTASIIFHMIHFDTSSFVSST